MPVVALAAPTALRVVDLSPACPMGVDGRRQAEAELISAEESRRPFDLATGPLIRAALLRLGDSDHAVVLTMHHIITDGWSLGVAALELSRLYEAFREGRPSPLEDLPIGYSDWRAGNASGCKAGPSTARFSATGSEALDGVPPLDLPSDRPRPGVRVDRGATRFFRLPAELSEGLRALGRREGVTPYMTLLAAFEALLSLASGQDDFAVGSPVANRASTEVEGLIGYFVNMIAIRADLSGDPTFRELLGRVREAALGAFEHQELPLDVLVEALQPRRDPARTPLFQVMFVLQNTLMPDALAKRRPADRGCPGAVGRDRHGKVRPHARDRGGRRRLFWLVRVQHRAFRRRDHRAAYRPVGIPPGRRRRASRGAAVGPLDPARSRASRQSRVGSGTGPRCARFPPRPRCVHELIAEQAARTPDAPAVVRGSEVVSYRELDAWADRLADVLRGLGGGAEVRVGLALDRSPSSWLGVVAGHAQGGRRVRPARPGLSGRSPAVPDGRLGHRRAAHNADRARTPRRPSPPRRSR